MILTLAWKELREHQGIWLTMVLTTVVLGPGLAHVVSMGDAHLAMTVAGISILAMAAAYGVVCGAMMFAGELEGGTLVFLDIFHGRRGRLWFGKFAIGAVLALTQALAGALALRLLGQHAPGWVIAVVGGHVANRADANPNVWFMVLPVLTLEAYCWGLLASSLAQRVLAGAAGAAVGITPVWGLALCTPPEFFFPIRLIIAIFLLILSYRNFLEQSHEVVLTAPPVPEGQGDPMKQFLDLWEEFEREDDSLAGAPVADAAAGASSAFATVPAARPQRKSVPLEDVSSAREPAPAPSPSKVLWWLTLEQARTLVTCLAGAGFLIGLLITPSNPQVLWPLATLLLGLACGTAAFAPEQRDLSYQFLAAQHFPLRFIWRFKVLFWLTAAILVTLMIFAGALVSFFLRSRRPGQPVVFAGTLPQLMGPTLFLGIWLLFGFCTGQLFVWLCRKHILALVVSFLAALAALGLWLPSLLCGGMGGWQVWVLPLTLLLATWSLMRAWAGGRIWERKPLTALVGFGVAVVAWAGLNYGYRAWELPDVGEPLDALAFRARIPLAKDNRAAKVIHQAVAEIDDPGDRWRLSLTEAARLPVGVLEIPRTDGQAPLLKDLPAYQKIADELLNTAKASDRGNALGRLAEMLALSRNLRNKAAVEFYLEGVATEQSALKGLDDWLTRQPAAPIPLPRQPDPALLRRMLTELNRHANETPSALDCLETECFRSGGLLLNPNAWSFAAPGAAGRLPERWLAGGIALSLDMPWEAERKTRLWQLVWAGLFRAVETPHWDLPQITEPVPARKDATRKILAGWLPAGQGPGAGITRVYLAGLLDESWLADERLFCAVVPLREAATRARWHMDAARLAVALSLYRLEQRKAAPELQVLVPNYFPAELPIDPYSGKSFRYRLAGQNEPQKAGGPVPGQGVLSGTGPDRTELMMLVSPWLE